MLKVLAVIVIVKTDTFLNNCGPNIEPKTIPAPVIALTSAKVKL